MKRSGCLILAVALACGSTATGADDADATSRILGAALSQDRGYATLAWLSDRIGPRLSGSKNLEQAVEWVAKELRKAGLDDVHTEKVLVPHWVRGVETGHVVAPAAHPMAITALGGSIPTPEGGVTAEVVEVTSLEALRAMPAEKIRGKIVLFNKKTLRNGGATDGYGAVVPMRSKGAIEASKLGAVGTLVRSVGTAPFRLPHTGAMGYEAGVPPIPSAAISEEDADLIHRLLAYGEPVRVNFVLGCATLPDAESANVVADLRGREKPDEVVLIGAHLDSWDVGTGAIDDGAGVAIVMETMRILRALDLRPRRTIRAVLFTNEENGLRGGKAYNEAHAAELAKHVVAIETDSGAARPKGFGVSAGEGGIDAVRKIAARLAPIGADEVTGNGGGADISPMKLAGVPQMGLRQDTTYYFDYHHSAADTLDKVDRAELALNIAAMAVMAYGLAEREEVLPRYVPTPEDIKELTPAPVKPAAR